MKTLDDIFEYLAQAEFDGARWPVSILWAWGKVELWHHILTRRCVCAIKGCKISHYGSIYLPDDITEWSCNRCDVEGIGNQTLSRYETFYEDELIRNLWLALRGQ